MTTERLTTALADRYRIERELGQGGMATVYLAHDIKHDRKVALKVLKPELAAVLGAERFVVEIKTTAALQHPHILPLFDSGTADGFLFYVMPFIDGETLRDKLNRETQLGVDEAVKIAGEVADALDYAHRHGVIHRDIKPENILLHDGRPMVADFGIALALSAAAGGRMTETGLSLGTPYYMSPEQATAEKEITGRSDIYSLASVLYEMLSGEPPHMGNSAQQIIMKIIADAPRPLTELRKSVPAHVANAVAQGLEKLPADRFTSAAEFAAAIQGRFATRARPGDPAGRGRDGRNWRGIALGAGAAAVAFAVLAAWASLDRPNSGADLARIEFAWHSSIDPNDRAQVEISRDGRRILQALVDSSGTSRIVMRDLGSTAMVTIAGTEGGFDPVFSHDGQWIAFQADGRLLKVSVSGGLAAVIADSSATGPGWGADGSILYTKSGHGVWRSPASGGPEVQLTDLDSARTEFQHWYPQELPGGRAAIFNSFSIPFSRSRIEAVDYQTGKRTVLVEGAIFPRYVSSGHLLFARDGAIFAAPFDPDKLRLLGPAEPVVQDLAWTATDGVAGYSVSENGTLVYLKASEWALPRRVVWADRTGNEMALLPEEGQWAEPRLAPNGRWVALTRLDPLRQVWLFDLGRRVLNQLSRSEGVSFNPVWLPDSRAVIHSIEMPVYDLQLAPIDGSAPSRLLSTGYDKLATSVSPDGKTVAYLEVTDPDRVMFAPIAGGASTPLEARPTTQRNGAFSPDGRWLAYEETGLDRRPEVYVRALDGHGARRQVSADGGDQPLWSRGGREIVYRKGAAVLSASFDPATGEAGTPALLFRKPDAGRLNAGRTVGYDVTPDGSRFLLVTPVQRTDAQPTVVIVNWLAELKTKVPR